MVDDISGHVAGSPQDGTGPHRRSGQAPCGGPRGAAPAAFQGQVQSPHRRHGRHRARLFHGRCGHWGSTGATRRATMVPICSWAGDDDSSLVVKEHAWRGLRRRTKRARQLRKAGAHTRNLTISGSNAGVLEGSEVLSLTPTQVKAIRVDAAKATFRLSHGQNAGTKMMAHAQASDIDPAFRHQVVLAWPTGVWEGVPDPRHQAGCAAWCHCQAQPPQAAVMRRHGRGSHLRAHAFAVGLERTVSEAPHHDGTTIDLLAVAPKTVVFFVDQASLLWSDSSAHWNHSKGPLFWEAVRPLLVAERLEGCRHGIANLLVKLVSGGTGSGLRGSGQRTTTAASFATRVHVPPLLRVPSPADRAGHASVTGSATGRIFFGATMQGTVRSLHFPLSFTNPAQWCTPTICPVLWHNRLPDGLKEGHIFTDGSSAGSGALRRVGWAVVAVDDLGNFKSAAFGAVPSDVLPGQTSRDGEDYAAPMVVTMDPLTLHIDCEGTTGPKCKALGAHVSSRLVGFPRRGQGNQGQGSRHTARRGGWALFPPF